MNTDVIDHVDAHDEADTVPEEQRTDPVQAFIDASTLPPRELRKDEVPSLREAALAALEERYGEFTPDMAAQVADPVHRFIILGEMSSKGWTKHKSMDRHRLDRSTAIRVLRSLNWRPMQIVRHMKAKDRRVIDFAVNNADDSTLPKWSEERAAAVAKRAHAAMMRAAEYGDAARPQRDALLHELSEGLWEFKASRKTQWKRYSPEDARVRRLAGKPIGRMWTNAELARLGHMSTAAVAQIRTGTAPSARRAASAA